MRFYFRYLTFAFALLPAIAFSTTPHPALNTLIRDTLSTHPLMAAQQAAIDAAKFGSATAQRQFMPTPALSIEQTVYENDLPGDNPDALSAVVGLSVPVYTGGRLTGQLEQARSRENLAQAELKQSRLELSTRVVEAWGGWVGAQLKVQAYADSVQQHQRLFALVQRRNEQGYSATADVEFARLRLQSVESDSLMAKTQLSINLAQLRIVSGKMRGDEPSLPVQLGEMGSALNWASSNMAVMTDKAIASSPGIMRANALLQESRADVDIANSRDWPDVVLSAEKQFGGIEIENRVRGDRSRIFFGISTQFGAGFSHRTEQKRVTAQVENSRQLGEAEKRLLVERVSIDNEELIGAQQKIAILRQALVSSESVLNSWERQFLEGRKQWQDLMNAAREKLQLQVQLADAQAVVQTAGWRLYLTCEGVESVLALSAVKANE